jgi:drug/metabolite transporter (DMT)-like permease
LAVCDHANNRWPALDVNAPSFGWPVDSVPGYGVEGVAVTVRAAEITIGRDLGPVGRWVRVGLGLLGVSYGVGGLVAGDAALLPTVGFVLALAGYYLLLHRLLGERMFARANPWFGTTLMLGSLAVFTMPFTPAPLHHAVGLYIGVALLITATIGYGGCEVAAPATWLLRRRYVLYCPYNAIDAAERPLHRLRTRATGMLAAVLTIVVGVYFLVGREILTLFDLPDPVASLWALVLLAPAMLVGYHAWRAARGTPEPGEVRGLTLGALVLVALAVYFAELVPQALAWPAVMLGGLLYATANTVVTGIRRRVPKRAP